MRALQAIVFDFDGVIADSERLHLRAYQDVLAPEGISISTEDYYEHYLGYDDVGVLKALGKDSGRPMDDGRVAALIERKGERYEELAAAGEMLFPGAAAFIRSAAAASVPVAIASGALTHEIDARARADGPAAALYGHRRCRSNRAKQARPRALSDGLRAVA